MLRLVAITPGTGAHLRCIAFLQLEPDFERYLTSHLRVCWPMLEILSSHTPLPRRLGGATFARPTGKSVQPHLIICGAAPTFTPVLPTIWLSEIERSTAPVQVGPKLWKTPTPITGAGLIRTIKLVLAAKTSA